MKFQISAVVLAFTGLITHTAQAQSRLDTPGCKVALPDNRLAAENLHQKKAIAGDACAQLNLAYFFYSNQSFGSATWWYGEAAKLGNVKAQFELAVLYRDGVGTQKNPVKAAQWMLKAADQGVTDAQLELGVMYDRGEGVKKDEVKAVHWLTKAASQGSDLAQYNLGLRYRTDLWGLADASSGTPHFTPDDKTALHWFCKAAKQGYAPAQFQVGDAYMQGRGIAVDYAQTRLWFRMAAAQGDDKAVDWLANDMSGDWYTVAEKWLKLQALRLKKPTCVG